jgi:asparagine synthase (glutamine-hydrolysing)
VTVLLTGEGADELFAGYTRYWAPQLSRCYRLLPEPVQRLAERLIGQGEVRRLGKLRHLLPLDPFNGAIRNSAFVAPDVLQTIWVKSPQAELSFRRNCLSYQPGIKISELVNNMLVLDQLTYLVAILDRQDKMSMAASVESRVPILDHRLVEFANSLPLSLKMRFGKNKVLLKKVALQVLPRAIVERRKVGFGVPVSLWLRDENGLGRYLDPLVHEGLGQWDCIDRSALKRLVDEHRSGVRDHGDILWILTSLEAWRQVFFKGQSMHCSHQRAEK